MEKVEDGEEGKRREAKTEENLPHVGAEEPKALDSDQIKDKKADLGNKTDQSEAPQQPAGSVEASEAVTATQPDINE